MANLIRSSKPGRNWSAGELLAYNITVKMMQPEAFFGPEANPSLDHLDPNILTAPVGVENPDVSDYTTRYLHYLKHAADIWQEKAIDDFAKETLDFLSFSERNIMVSTRIIPLTVCGEIHRTQLDVCLLHHRTLILLVLLEDKTPFGWPGAESPVIAEAIAAFQFNNMPDGNPWAASLYHP